MGAMNNIGGRVSMDHFRRSVIRILVGTIVLLFFAWVGLKVMQYNGDYERLVQDWRNVAGGWGDGFTSAFDRVKEFVQSLIEKAGLAKG